MKSYKVHQIEAVPREEWVEVAGTHEAIIDYETSTRYRLSYSVIPVLPRKAVRYIYSAAF